MLFWFGAIENDCKENEESLSLRIKSKPCKLDNGVPKLSYKKKGHLLLIGKKLDKQVHDYHMSWEKTEL